MKRAIYLLLALAALVTLVVSGCAKPAPAPAPTPGPAPAPAPAPKPAAAPTPPPKAAAAPAPAPKPPQKIPVLIAGPPSTWIPTYACAVAAADIANANTNLNVTVKSLAGTAPVINGLIEGNFDLGFGPAEYNWGPPFNSEQEWTGKPPAKNLRAVLSYVRMYSSISVPSRSGIKTVPELRGKRMMWHTASAMGAAQAILEAYGIDPKKDVQQIMVPSHIQSVKEIIMGRGDAYWTAVEGVQVVELAQSVGKIFPLPVEQAKFEWMKQNRLSAVRGMALGKIPAGYMDHLDIPPGGLTIVANIWTAGTHTGVSTDTIYTFTKAWLDNAAKFRTVHKQTAEFGPDLIQTPSEIPYHEGAVKALKEAGMWTAEMERVNQARLKQAGASK